VVELIDSVRQEMFAAAEALDFERAAKLRDQLKRLRGEQDVSAVGQEAPRARSGGAGARAAPGRGSPRGAPRKNGRRGSSR
jgi:excinuclease ABC subunit B